MQKRIKWLGALLECWLLLAWGVRVYAVPPPPPATLSGVTGGAQYVLKPAGGTTDDAPRIQALVNLLNTLYSGGKIILTPGHFLIKTNVTDTHVLIEGCEPVPTCFDYTIPSNPVPANATYTTGDITHAVCRLDITANEDNASAESPFLFSGNGGIRNVAVFYPNLGTSSSAAATPAHDYPFTFHAQHEGLLENISIFVARRGVFMEGRRGVVRNVVGSCTDIGLRVDNAPDVTRVENVHIVPNAGGGAFTNYIKAHLTSFDIKRCDFLTMVGCVTFATNIGFLLENGTSPTGGPNAPWAVLTNCAADVASTASVRVSQAQLEPVNFVNCHFTSLNYCVMVDSSFTGFVSFTGGLMYDISSGSSGLGCLYNAGNGYIKCTGVELLSDGGTGIGITAVSGKTEITDCNFVTGFSTAYGKFTSGAKVIVKGCTFLDAGTLWLTGTGASINTASPPTGVQFGAIYGSF